MNRARVSLTAAATLILSSSMLFAQSATADTEQKPSPYQGVSVPPAADTISPSEEAPAQAAPVQPAPVAVPAPAAAPLPAPPIAAPAAAPVPAASSNPDAGIIETPLPPSTPDYNPHAAAKLQGRSLDTAADEPTDNKDGGIVTYVPSPANALPSGTVFKVSMLEDIDAASTHANAPFRARLAQDILRNGKVAVPVGSELHGKVVYATAGNRLNGGSVIRLRPDEFVLPDGTRYHLHAEAIETAGSNTRTKGEGNIVANQHGKRTLAELGAGVGSGAIVGAAVGGGVGAVVGTAVGAGVVTAHWLRTNWSANLPESSSVVFSLIDPMVLTPLQDQKTELAPRTF